LSTPPVRHISWKEFEPESEFRTIILTTKWGLVNH